LLQLSSSVIVPIWSLRQNVGMGIYYRQLFFSQGSICMLRSFSK